MDEIVIEKFNDIEEALGDHDNLLARLKDEILELRSIHNAFECKVKQTDVKHE